MDKKIGIFTFEQFQKKSNIGSTRIRVKWLVNYWPEAEEFVMGRKYDVVIYQKAYWIEHAERFEGIKILDVCDADWMHWGTRMREMIDVCDAVTTSTVPIAVYLKKLCPDKPVWCIPDRIDFETLKDMKKNHRGKGRAKVAGWFGYSQNFAMLTESVNALVTLGIEELVVIANKQHPFQLPASVTGKIRLINYPWTEATMNRDLLTCDVIINPQANYGRWKYKSNNKTIHAWALGLPVATNKDQLEIFMDEAARVKESDFRFKEMREKYNVKDSVEEYRNLILELKQGS